ncbi:hypothetical protein AWE51_22130 [Aquimarina aggregata]|uniref:Uncharacterized protein n=1 Tax=Aquimarina aggregata TaxID=1642818 RepID=A0A162CS81_9FLAO|nr:hypothetical protein [Aquimarina aggregata]KZS41404.1 hypothetical protein AWE51_22130 [Aquimarina aggregata]
MKKIVLTLGILLGTISTYAISTDLNINTKMKNSAEVTSTEDLEFCTRITHIYNHDGEIVDVVIQSC